jgi:hypothetical protein
MPSTIARSSNAVQRTWTSTHESAVAEYGEGERAHRVAFASVKHSFEKVGDHWERKAGRGPSDHRAATGRGPTAEGVDANASKEHLLGLARRLGVEGRSRMTKGELVDALKKANRRKTASARKKGRS